jgi:hypothetical protein
MRDVLAFLWMLLAMGLSFLLFLPLIVGFLVVIGALVAIIIVTFP